MSGMFPQASQSMLQEVDSKHDITPTREASQSAQSTTATTGSSAEESQFNGHSTPGKEIKALEDAPLEVRHVIYEHLLPTNRVIRIGRDNGGVGFGALSKTSRKINGEIKAWFFNGGGLARKYVYSATAQWGRWDPSDTSFAIAIDAGYNLELSHVLERLDFAVVRRLTVTFENADEPGWHRENMNAVWELERLPNLEQIDFVLGFIEASPSPSPLGPKRKRLGAPWIVMERNSGRVYPPSFCVVPVDDTISVNFRHANLDSSHPHKCKDLVVRIWASSKDDGGELLCSNE